MGCELDEIREKNDIARTISEKINDDN